MTLIGSLCWEFRTSVEFHKCTGECFWRRLNIKLKRKVYQKLQKLLNHSKMDIFTHAPGALILPLNICVTYQLLPLGAEEYICSLHLHFEFNLHVSIIINYSYILRKQFYISGTFVVDLFPTLYETCKSRALGMKLKDRIV